MIRKMWPAFALVLLLIQSCSMAPLDSNSTENTSNSDALASAGDANEFVDEAITHWRSLLRESGYDPLHVESFSQGMISCQSCEIRGLSTIQRTGDVMLNTSETYLIIDLNVGFIEITATCQCTANWAIFSANGAMSGTLTDYSLAGRIEQYANTQRPPQLTYLKITDEGQLRTHFDGKGFFGTLLQWFGQDFIRNRIKGIISSSSEMKGLLGKAITDLDISKVLVF